MCRMLTMAWLVCFVELLTPVSMARGEWSRPAIPPLDGCAWMEAEGIRAAWISYKQIDDQSLQWLSEARINTVFLKHGFHDFLALNTARWEEDRLVVDMRDTHLHLMLENTHRAAAAGIHVFWIANYELQEMLPHLQRLGYQSAFAEGPARYLRSGPHQDAAPLDPVFWRQLTGAHGELIAQLSRRHPIEGLLYDTEHYAGGIMYLQNGGFSDATYAHYLQSRALRSPATEVPAGKRYAFLKSSGRLPDYYLFLEEEAFEQGRELAERWHAINPHLVLGIWPLLDNWFARGMLRGFGGAVPALGLSGAEYYHGSDQTKSLAEFFESQNVNLMYVPGFYPTHSYSVAQLQHHVAQALKATNRYWMLGPLEVLRQPTYQTALRTAFQSTAAPAAEDMDVELDYRVEKHDAAPYLLVRLRDFPQSKTPPRLSLHASFGGAPLCALEPMHHDGEDHVARIPLRRRVSNNRFLPDGFRAGVVYSLNPTPREMLYEDPFHTKLIDGRAYGYFGTTVAWGPRIQRASATFDLQRPYRAVQLEISQPTKLDDRIGGPAELVFRTADKLGEWSDPQPFRSHFDVTLKDVTEPDTTAPRLFDKRHDRAWLSWRTEVASHRARWLRIDLERKRANSSLSLGEVVVWADFDGEVAATIHSGGRQLPIRQGRRFRVPQ